ncbi:MAG: hypothetical protein ACI8V7_000592 [Candidatus Paceibacteria bacterium]|jgi:hypothetical protein
MNKFNKQKNTKKGFAVLYAIIVSVVILSVVTSIVSISLKQRELNTVIRESQSAFYAANSGVECALYWDRHSVQLGKFTFPFKGNLRGNQIDQEFPSIFNDKILCAGSSIVTESVGADGFWDWSEGNNKVQFSIRTVGSICANVQIEKEIIGTVLRTTITSKGYNTCEIGSKNSIERGLVIQYET